MSSDLTPQKHAVVASLQNTQIATAKRVIQSFNTWAFKREQPSSVDLLHSIVAAAIQRGAPIPFVLYWGKGPRRSLAVPDLQCLDYIASMGERIAEQYAPGALFNLLLTDTHAGLNEHAETDTKAYYAAIETAASARAFQCRYLSEVTRSSAASLHPQESEVPPAEVLEALTKSAAKWYRGDGTPSEGAVQYFELNMLEKRAVELEFPDTVFVTFNNSKHRILFPKSLPIFYMYSLKKGVAVKPWFVVEASSTRAGIPSTSQHFPKLSALS
jgi:L-tyrosine isonitrile synthase